MPSRSQVPGRKQSSNTSALATSSEQHLRLRLDVQVDDPLAAVQQVAVLGRHRQPAGAAHPHHVGAQVGEHHPRVRARPDAAEFDDFDPGQGSRTGHGVYLPFFNCSTRLRKPSVPVSIVPLMARFNTKPGQRHHRVDAELKFDLGALAVGRSTCTTHPANAADRS